MEDPHFDTAPVARALARISVVAPLVFALTWGALGWARPGYSWVTQPISGLGVGPGATLMNAAFITTGVLQVMGIVGALRLMSDVGSTGRWISGIVLALSGAGAVLCGLFTWQSFAPHMVGSSLGLVGPVFGFLAMGLTLRRVPRWRAIGRSLLLAAGITFALGVAFFATFNLDDVLADRGVAGLVERALATEIQIVYSVLSMAALSKARATGTGREAP